MKFLNIVSWARRSARLDQAVTARTSPVPAMAHGDQAIPVSVLTETMAIWSDMAEKKRRRSMGHGKSWRPSLDAISETATLRTMPSVTAGKEGDRKSRGKKVKVKGRVTLYTGCDDLRHFGSATMMPSFSPPAFLF